MSNSSSPQVFISYARDDIEIVRNLYFDLKVLGVNLWFDEVELKPGMRWKTEIERSIPQSKYFIFCLSKASLRKTGTERTFVDEELQMAYQIAMKQDEKAFKIVPVRIEDCGLGDNRLSVYQQVVLHENWKKGIISLAEELGVRSTTRVGKTWDSPYGKIALVFELGKYELAQELCNKHIAEEELISVDILMLKGLCKKGMNDYVAAKHTFHGILQMDEENVDARVNLAGVYLESKELDEALRLYKEVLSIDSEHVLALAGIGEVFFHKDEIDDAIANLSKARELAFPEWNTSFGKFLQAFTKNENQEQLWDRASHNKNEILLSRINYFLGECYFRSERYFEAAFTFSGPFGTAYGDIPEIQIREAVSLSKSLDIEVLSQTIATAESFAIGLEGNLSKHYLALVLALLEKGRVQEGILVVQELIKKDAALVAAAFSALGWPSDSPFVGLDSFIRWLALKNLGESAEAEAALLSACSKNKVIEIALSNNPDLQDIPSYEQWILKALLRSTLSLYEEAVAAINKAIDLKKDTGEAWEMKASMLSTMGHFEESLSAINQALEYESANSALWTEKGFILINLLRNDEAIETLDKALSISSDDSRALDLKADILLESEKNEGALELIERALEIMPDNVLFQYKRAVALFQMGRFQDTLDSVNKTLETNKLFVLGHYLKGHVLFELGNYEEAVDPLKHVTIAQHDLEEAHLLLAATHQQLGQYEEAVKDLETLLLKNGENAEVWSGLGAIYCEMEEYEKALEASEKALNASKESANAWNNKGYALAKLGRYEEALPACERAIELTQEAAFYHSLGFTLNHLGRHKEALSAYEEALRLDPGHELALKEKRLLLKSLEKG